MGFFTSVPVLTFVFRRGGLFYEGQRETSNYMILVQL